MKSPTKKELLTAFSTCSVALQQSPGSTAPVQKFLSVLQHTDKTENLSYFAQRLLKKFPHSVTPLQALAAQFFQRKQFESCLAVTAELKKSDPEDLRIDIILARVYLALGDYDAAKAQLATAREASPQSAAMLDFSCQMGIANRDWGHVLATADSWLAIDAVSPKALQFKSQALFELTRYEEAADVYSKVLKAAGNDAGSHNIMGRLCSSAGRYDNAKEHLCKALELDPTSPEILHALSDLYRILGDLGASETYCLKAIEQNQDYPLAYIQLSKLRQGNLDESITAKIRQLLDIQSLHPDHRAALEFSLADSFDRTGNHREAFDHYQKGNLINRQISDQEGIRFNPDKIRDDLDVMARFFETQDPVTDINPAEDSVIPIFIVGMPRSGTTLLESILAAHSRVIGAGELRSMPKIYTEFVSFASQNSVDTSKAFLLENREKWQREYLAELPDTEGCGWIVDKQPINYQSIGLIRSIFPGARILHLTRPPLETCFSIFRHNFSKYWPFAHDLKDVGTYYATYARTCAVWHRLVDARGLLHASYTRLIDDLESEARNIVSFCGLDWEEACLSPHLSARPITTPSAVQVRTPVSKAFSGRSAYYREMLDPLIETLTQYSIDPDRENFDLSA